MRGQRARAGFNGRQMGIFSFGKSLARRNEAVAAIQSCFESFGRNGVALPRDYRQLATDLVGDVWPAVSLLCGGEGKTLANRVSIAAFAIAKGIGARRNDERTANLLAAALGVMLKSLTSEASPVSLHEVDKILLDQARKLFLDYGSALSMHGATQPSRLRRPGEKN
jgi:hypothetical protein